MYNTANKNADSEFLHRVITYRETRDFTADALFRLFDSVGWSSANYPHRLVRAMQGSSCVISAWDGDRLAGLVNVLDDGEMTAYVHYLLVDRQYHGVGIGKKLALAVKEKYKDYLYIVLVVESRENTAFYERLGFRITRGATPMDITNP